MLASCLLRRANILLPIFFFLLCCVVTIIITVARNVKQHNISGEYFSRISGMRITHGESFAAPKFGWMERPAQITLDAIIGLRLKNKTAKTAISGLVYHAFSRHLWV